MTEQQLAAVKQALQEYVNADNCPLEMNPRKRAALDALAQQPAVSDKRTNDEPVVWVEYELGNHKKTVQPVAKSLSYLDALKDAFFEGFTSVKTYNDTLLNSPEEAWLKYKPPTTRSQPAAREPHPFGDRLSWSENQKPCEKVRYDHCTAETPFGRFLLTWKGWKESDSICADETPWGDFSKEFDTLEEAKAGCEAEYVRRLRLATAPQQKDTP